MNLKVGELGAGNGGGGGKVLHKPSGLIMARKVCNQTNLRTILTGMWCEPAVKKANSSRIEDSCMTANSPS
ncbi:Dual specificity mitogen-activated protein kinase kinase 1 [Orchesella cincta]|uniref:Dual specificity mitogen-activated protein kinase kinase 1 n=1 Tax=Orchesella cincta TaxID=48709 RepID=A0A1D2MZS7_ORCCI|nr:Dual specificity mitogen-activated protein kinase kinase 1 [Orchesella cincta]